jgi:hypothetical protein
VASQVALRRRRALGASLLKVYSAYSGKSINVTTYLKPLFIRPNFRSASFTYMYKVLAVQVSNLLQSLRKGACFLGHGKLLSRRTQKVVVHVLVQVLAASGYVM